MKRLEKKTAVVTGGSRGLGKGVVKALVNEGANVWAVSRNERDLAALATEVDNVQTLALDISESGVADRVFGTVQRSQ